MKYHVAFDLDFRRNPYPGKFIVLEGIEASGKTTQAKILGEILSKNQTVFVAKNPTDGEIGTYIRNEILSGNNKKISPIAYQYLFAADRVTQQAELIERLKKGETIICDRYIWTSVAYGIADRQSTDYRNWEEVSVTALSLLSMYHQFISPDMSIYLDISLKESLRRIKGSAKHVEIYDNNKANIKIKTGYDWIRKTFPKEITIVNGEKPLDEITKEIVELISKIQK
jgi:dTMP kinase